MKFAKLVSLIGMIFLCSSVCSIQAQASETGKIVFVSARDGNREIYIMNPDSSEQENLTQNSADDLYPAWSPTGEQILFVSDRDGVRDLYLMDANGSNVRKVFKNEAHREHPTWAPDGKQIAYESGNIIYIATLGQQKEEHLVQVGSGPAWSPDGTEIAFASGTLGNYRLTLINVQTGRQKLILPAKVRPWQRTPAWSPTGEKIAFSWLNHDLPIGLLGDLVDRETIYIVKRDGTGRIQRIVDEAGPKATHPAWSPNSNTLIYTQEINNRLQLFKINPPSRVRAQLTHVGNVFQANALADWLAPSGLPVSPQPELLTTMWGEMKDP